MIHMERLTWDNYDDVLNLKVAKEQKEYIVPNSDSLIHAFFAMTENKAQIFPFGIYLGKTPVGFMMIARDVPWIEQYYGSPAKYYYIWRFMIDKRYQGNGYGKEAIRRWIISGLLVGVRRKEKFYVAKEDLILFLLSDHYRNIVRKSDIHIKRDNLIKEIL